VRSEAAAQNAEGSPTSYLGIRAVVFLASVRFARYIPQSERFAVRYFQYRGVFTLGIRYGSWYSVRT